MNSPFAAWHISADGFPSDGSSEEKIWFMLNYAILAPSTHNTQPWLFRVHSNQVELHADWSRSLPEADPEHRELIMSCGTALFHLKLAIHYFGHSCWIELFPDEANPNFLARIHLGFHAETDAEQVVLFNAIPLRRTNRGPFQPTPVAPALLQGLKAAAAKEGAWFQILDSQEIRNTIADLIAAADEIQWQNKAFRKELAAWMHPNAEPKPDGIPGYAEGLGDLASYAGPLLVRTFDLGKGRAVKDREIALFSPALAVLGADNDTAYDWIIAGQALARVLLLARVEGVWASFLNQPIEVPTLRPQVASACACPGPPQIILRLGYAEPVRPTPRRPLNQVVTSSPHSSFKV